jgi:hypothetical protein
MADPAPGTPCHACPACACPCPGVRLAGGSPWGWAAYCPRHGWFRAGRPSHDPRPMPWFAWLVWAALAGM